MPRQSQFTEEQIIRALEEVEAVADYDRARREGLLRYVLRPPISHHRLRYLLGRAAPRLGARRRASRRRAQ